MNETVTIGAPDSAVRLREPQSARVSVSVVPAPVEWSVGQVPVTVLHANGTVLVMPKSVLVQVRGPRELAGSAGGADH